ncbi:hypothetical protein DY000_02047836 [Brassica cretica]|uniref:Uncharacterized protein n=1 Tax=Brassica cretica TaxID=69181 RepID=A0ABQ7ETV1_BRACR|nr:hypothetical protein DY000_02047836 [Brassica cretica]
MTPMRPRLYRGSRFFFEIFFGTLRPYRNPEVLPWILRSLIGTRRLCGNPEVLPQMLYIGPEILWGTVGFLSRSGVSYGPEVTWEPGIFVWISHSAAWKLANIEFLCCILLLQEVTDRLRGCWCGRYDPSARLRCFPRLEKQGFHCSMYFKGPRCALGCTGVLGSFDSILRLAHTHSCFMSHTYFNLVDVPLFARVGQDRRYRRVIQVSPPSTVETSSDWGSSRVAGH